MIKFLITYLPLVAVLWAWLRVYRRRHTQPVNPPSFIALVIVTANAVLAAGTFVYYRFRAIRSLPPWQDPEILMLALLFFLAPIGMLFGFLAFRRGEKWLVWLVEITSIWLFLIGCLAGLAV